MNALKFLCRSFYLDVWSGGCECRLGSALAGASSSQMTVQGDTRMCPKWAVVPFAEHGSGLLVGVTELHPGRSTTAALRGSQLKLILH